MIAVLGILISFLLPSIKDARLEAESAVCKSNTQQISHAIYIWSKEYGGKLPSAYTELNGSYKFWHLAMVELLEENFTVMNCPTGWDDTEASVLRKVSDGSLSDYGWNWSGYNTDSNLFGLGNDPRSDLLFTHRGGSAFMAEIQDPDSMITFGDRGSNWSIRSLIGNTNFAVQAVMPMVHKKALGGNIFFLDGSTRFLTASRLYSPESQSMWSRAAD